MRHIDSMYHCELICWWAALNSLVWNGGEKFVNIWSRTFCILWGMEPVVRCSIYVREWWQAVASLWARRCIRFHTSCAVVSGLGGERMATRGTTGGEYQMGPNGGRFSCQSFCHRGGVSIGMLGDSILCGEAVDCWHVMGAFRMSRSSRLQRVEVVTRMGVQVDSGGSWGESVSMGVSGDGGSHVVSCGIVPCVVVGGWVLSGFCGCLHVGVWVWWGC